MNKKFVKRIACLVFAGLLAAFGAPGNMRALGDDLVYGHSYFAGYCEEVDEADIVQLKKDSAAYGSIKKFLYDIACNTPYVPGKTDCSGEVTRALCYGLGGASASSYKNIITLDDLSNAAYIYLDGKLVNSPTTYYSYLLGLENGTEVTLSALDGTSARYTKYYVDSIPKTITTQAEADKAKEVFDAIKHPGTIGLLASGRIGATAIKGHMWLSLGAFPTDYSADDIAAYLNEEYLSETGVSLGSESATQAGINWRYEVNLFPAAWGCTTNVLRCSSNSPAAGMEVNNQYSGFEAWGELIVLIPVDAESGTANDITTREKPAVFRAKAVMDPSAPEKRYELLCDGVRYFGKAEENGDILWYSDYQLSIKPLNADASGKNLTLPNGKTAVVTVFSGLGYENDRQITLPVTGECMVKIEAEGAALSALGNAASREREAAE